MVTRTPTRARKADPPHVRGEILPIVVRLDPVVELTEDQFANFCAMNREIRIERTASGELELMSPTHSDTGIRNADITAQLGQWSEAGRNRYRLRFFHRLQIAEWRYALPGLILDTQVTAV